MFKNLHDLLNAGYEVCFRPLLNGDVTLTVQEAKNGTVEAVSVDLNPFEWLAAEGVNERLAEARSILKV